jgi:hypothetical protein
MGNWMGHEVVEGVRYEMSSYHLIVITETIRGVRAHEYLDYVGHVGSWLANDAQIQDIAAKSAEYAEKTNSK